MITRVNFHEFYGVEDSKIEFSVIVARHKDKWVFVQHKQRTTWEIPGGHRELGESPLQTARRELQEETGALEIAALHPVCIYSVERDDGSISYGGLYFAQVASLGCLDEKTEIGTVALFDQLPQDLTYPEIQPLLHNQVCNCLDIK